MRTLIVEDDFSSRLLLQVYLSKFGECHIAANGREAIDAFQKAREQGWAYDLICLDIMMPEVDGLTALETIRKLELAAGIMSGAGVKIIMTTALKDSEHVIHAFNEMCDAYVTKPVDLRKLLKHIQDLKLVPLPPESGQQREGVQSVAGARN